MKVVCDNCGAMYKIPDEKLVKPVNKATCRQCGHRMLIPRPRRGADPDERTLVTAVPPTPAPPPMRDDSGPPTTPLHADSEEKTLPTGGSAPEETRWIRNDVPGAARGAAVAAVPVDRSAMTERLPAHGGPSTPQPQPQTPAPTPRPSVRPSSLDEIDLAAEVATHDTDDTPRAIPNKAGTKSKSKSTAAAPHDPRGDLGLALFGVIVAGLGVLILGVDSVLDAGDSRAWYYGILAAAVVGTVLAVAGISGAFFVLVTGGRGRKPAWKVASVVLALLLGVVAGAVPATLRVGVDTAASTGPTLASFFDVSSEEFERSLLADVTPEPEPVAPAEPAEAAPEGSADADADADADAAASAEPTQEPAAGSADPAPAAPTSGTRTAAPAPTSRTTRSTSSSGTSGTTRTTTPTRIITTSDPAPTRTRSSAPVDEKDLPDDLDDLGAPPTRSRSAASDLPEKPPMQAIDIMVKTNVNVKRCFFDYQKAEGKLPTRLEVPFTIKPNGDAADISIKQGKYSGGALEACLIKAIRGINFPPSQRGTSLVFPFVFS